MLFGESFQEPPISTVRGFTAFGGSWRASGGELSFFGAAGDKLVSDLPATLSCLEQAGGLATFEDDLCSTNYNRCLNLRLR
jgi:hypothetical protein